MVEPSCVADGDFAVGGDDVMADAPFVLRVIGGLGFGACGVGLFGGFGVRVLGEGVVCCSTWRIR